MNTKRNPIDSIEEYLDEVAEEEAAGWEQDVSTSEHADWFDKQAADFLAKPEVDPTMEEILEATRAFTRKNFALRSGLLYRQQLQNTPSYEIIMELEPMLVELAGEANRVHEAKANADLYDDRKQSIEQAHQKRLVQWAVEELLPQLEGSKVVKVTRSTKKPKTLLAQCPSHMFAQLGIKYKELLEKCISPNKIYMPLANSIAGCNVREWMGRYTQRDTAPESVLISTLWSAKERKQWLYGLVEYATELVNLVAHASALDPTMKPRKYLCYFQKKSEATLYRGQEELEALVKNMQADHLLPDYETGEAKGTPSSWDVPLHHEAIEKPLTDAELATLDEEPVTYGRRATDFGGIVAESAEDKKDKLVIKPAVEVEADKEAMRPINTATQRLRERMAARQAKADEENKND